MERAYYHCRSCGKGTVPWDEALDLIASRLLDLEPEIAWVY